eukprot:jgi/Ulvmu1/11395/UM075_0057.1
MDPPPTSCSLSPPATHPAPPAAPAACNHSSRSASAAACRRLLSLALRTIVLLLLCFCVPSAATQHSGHAHSTYSTRSSGTCSAGAGTCTTAAAPDTAGGANGGTDDGAADYVIIGGGTAGSVLAARLCAALPGRSFVLLERGAPRSEDGELHVRAMRHAFTMWQDPALTQTWASQPNPGLGGRNVSVRTASTLGGSSAIAGGQWTKPPLATFDSREWAFDGLSSSKAAELFARAETQLRVAVPPAALMQTHAQSYLDAAAAAGFSIGPDPAPNSATAPRGDAMWHNAVTADGAGRRLDAYTAYAAPAAAGPCAQNLRVVQPAAAARIVISGGRAVAVEYLRTDVQDEQQRARRVDARVGVLLCAGPYGSPQLLQLSGVGPGGLLRMHGIDVLRDLPVGLNSISRPRVSLVDAYTTTFAPENDGALVNAPEARARFLSGGGGVLGVPVAATSGVLPAQHAYTFASNTAPGPMRGMPLITSTCAVNPTARGGVAIASADPVLPPFVHTNLLGSAADAARALACLRRLQAVTAQLQPALGLMSVVPGEGAVVQEGIVRETTDFLHHTVGGCELGAVVGGDFGVLGVEGLRAVDASVLPDMPPFAGPLATVYMIAELAAERVLHHEQGSVR